MIMPSQLKHRVDLQEFTGTVNREWKTIAERWAKIETSDGQTFTITLRYDPEITLQHRFKFRSRVFNLESVGIVDEWQEYMTVVANELPDDTLSGGN